MKWDLGLGILAFAALGLFGGCGSEADATFDSGASSGTSSSVSGTGAGGETSASSSATGAGGDMSTSTATSSSSGAGAGGGAADVSDPAQDGPYLYTEIDKTTPASGGSMAIHCAYPTSGPEDGPYPVVVVAHGFQLPPDQYYGYVRRLASFGYVALTADYSASLFSVNNVKNAEDLLAALDWAGAAPELAGKVDVNNAGMTGHSMGGKLALLAATMDARVKASITLDPVDSSMNCSATDCPDVSMLLPIPIPTGFIGETTDASGGFQPCAPAADNFTTFYGAASSPSLEVTVTGANHMSFLDDVASCGIVCNFCNQATASNQEVNGLSKAFVVAFYERYLRGNQGYDDYLTGPKAEALYVATNKASIASK